MQRKIWYGKIHLLHYTEAYICGKSKHIVKAKCLKVSTSQVIEFLQFIQEVCAWFPTVRTPLLSHSRSEKEATRYHNSDW